MGFTDEARIAETAVWPNFFLMNVFFVLKGSKLFIIIGHQRTPFFDQFRSNTDLLEEFLR